MPPKLICKKALQVVCPIVVLYSRGLIWKWLPIWSITTDQDQPLVLFLIFSLDYPHSAVIYTSWREVINTEENAMKNAPRDWLTLVIWVSWKPFCTISQSCWSQTWPLLAFIPVLRICYIGSDAGKVGRISDMVHACDDYMHIKLGIVMVNCSIYLQPSLAHIFHGETLIGLSFTLLKMAPTRTML